MLRQVESGAHSMKHAAAVAMGIILAGCVPAPPPAVPVAAGAPIVLDPAIVRECALIEHQIADQQRNAAFGSVMPTPITQAAVQINAYNVIEGLRERAAIIGCA
jgi:hypothetical protein